MKIALVLVNYYKEKDLAAFIKQYLISQVGCDLEVYIVDNGSRDRNILVDVSTNMNFVHLIEPGRNTGYIGAAALAYNQLKSEGILPDLFVLSNFDLQMDRIHFFERLTRSFLATGAACVAPAIRSGRSGRNLNPYYVQRIAPAKLRRLVRITSWYPIYLFYQFLHILKGFFIKGSESQATEIYAPHGSFMALHRTYFDRGADLNYGSFLYGEELFVAEMLRSHNLRAVYDPELELIHDEHTTTGVVKTAAHMRYLHESLVYLYKNFFQ
ncbi:MAG: hypothetical protein RL220_1335 [Bacteroidota bacterium]